MKTRKFLSLLLVLAMVLSFAATSAFATNTNTSTTIGNLTVSVDNAVEGMYFSGNSVLCEATNGYYPFSFSLIVSSRSNISGKPVVKDANNNVVADAFHWAYLMDANNNPVMDNDGNYIEDPNTTYGLVTLPVSSSSTVTITSSDNTTAVLSCAQPNGGTGATGASLYAYLPAPGQFTNEGVTTGGWGDAYASNGVLKGNASTGMSLGFFGGYAVYQFDNPIANNPANPYGVDFIVYGNAFWANSEPGCIQVSKNGTTWYDIAGSLYYNADTVKNASITYTNPNVSEDASFAAAGNNLGTLDNVAYSLNGVSGTITKNNFHKHSWFPLKANYFSANSGRADMSKVDSLPFVSRTLSSGVASTLTFTGVKLSNVSTSATGNYGFGYCDVHPNKTLGGSIAYNPYQTFTSSSDYNTKTAGTSGGDPIDISWAVNPNGTPANLDSINYVRIYTGSAQMNGVFGEISTEVCGIAKATGTGSGAATSDIQIWGTEQIAISNMGNISVVPGTYYLVSAEDYVFVNGVRITASPMYSLTVESGREYQIITQSGTESPYITVIKGQ